MASPKSNGGENSFSVSPEMLVDEEISSRSIARNRDLSKQLSYSSHDSERAKELSSAQQKYTANFLDEENAHHHHHYPSEITDDDLHSPASSGHHRRVAIPIMLFVIILGIASASSLLALGLSNAFAQQRKQFERAASDVAQQIAAQFQQYVQTASTIHMRCRDRTCTRTDFRELYEYLIHDSENDQPLFEAMQFDPNITHAERAMFEAEAREFYAENYPHVEYRGFVGFEGAVGTSPRSNASFYFPIHFMEPILGNEAAIDLDYYSHISRRASLLRTLESGEPTITDRLTLVHSNQEQSRCGGLERTSFGVVLMHPGIPLSTRRDVWPRDLSSLVICIPTLMMSAIHLAKDVGVYIYEEFQDDGAFTSPHRYQFMGGLFAGTLEFQPEVSLDEIRGARLEYETTIPITNKKWRIAVIALKGTYEPHVLFVVLGSVLVLLASICLALWAWQSSQRIEAVARLKAEAEAEKASLILESARLQTSAERELNEYLEHEVKNPISAAIAAVSFVKLATATEDPSAIRPDVQIIENSLRFVNDLLRNMLDMHRASHRQLKVKMAPTDILHDVLEPVRGMLHQRSGPIELLVECPDNLCVITDGLRLKQICLNLGRNSSKFISTGFIRFRAELSMRGTVRIMVEDSGSGVPISKRSQLFSKFQESLDVLSQGTGVGLFLCKKLTQLMGGKIMLDYDYHSGIEGHPGARFVIDLNVAPLPVKEAEESASERLSSRMASASTDNHHLQLPENLNVLFVDDDAILRKLFSRAVQLVAPTWKCHQAANGETAIRFVDESGVNTFDIIFMDMYMASVDKQLLGTETVVELRSRGVRSRICGLSANDKEREFVAAGADTFCIKPLPCEKEALTKELSRVLSFRAEDDKGNT